MGGDAVDAGVDRGSGVGTFCRESGFGGETALGAIKCCTLAGIDAGTQRRDADLLPGEFVLIASGDR